MSEKQILVIYQIGLLQSLPSTLDRLEKLMICGNTWKLAFSEPEAWLTFVGSRTLDTNLGMFIPKWGLDIAAADRFAKTNKVKTINEDTNNNLPQIKT